MGYRRSYQIEFNHCDPAGIVFYPRYFELINSVIENYFADVADYSFARIHLEGKGNAVPAVSLAAEFLAPSRLGDLVEFLLDVERLGASSLTLLIKGSCQGEPRISARITVVWTENMKAVAWPDPIRQRIETFRETAT